MGKNLPYCRTFLSLPRHFRWLRYDRYGRCLGLQLGNFILEGNYCWIKQPKALRKKISFFDKNRKLVFHHCRLPWKIQMPQWYLLNGCDLTPEKPINNSQMEITQSQRQYIPHKMGPFINSLCRQDLHFRRKVQQWLERYSRRWFGKGNNESNENKCWGTKSKEKTQCLLCRKQHVGIWRF